MQPVALSMPHSAVAMQLPLVKTDRDGALMIAALRHGAHTHKANMAHIWHTDHKVITHADGRWNIEMADGKRSDGTNAQLAHSPRIAVCADGGVCSHTFLTQFPIGSACQPCIAQAAPARKWFVPCCNGRSRLSLS